MPALPGKRTDNLESHSGIEERSEFSVKYGIMEAFRMHSSQMEYGLAADGDRVLLFSKAGELGFQGIEFGIGLDYREDPLWTGMGELRQEMKEASQATGVEAASVCLHLLNYKENSPASDTVEHRKTAHEIIRKTIEACAHIGASVILVPFFWHRVAEIRRSDPEIDRRDAEAFTHSGR